LLALLVHRQDCGPRMTLSPSTASPRRRSAETTCLPCSGPLVQSSGFSTTSEFSLFGPARPERPLRSSFRVL
jgi:hypothetical protein